MSPVGVDCGICDGVGDLWGADVGTEVDLDGHGHGEVAILLCRHYLGV